MAATVVIIDDVTAIRVLLRTALEAETDFVVVADAASLEVGVTVIRDTQPDAVIIDLSVDDTNGRPLAAVREASPRSRVVVYSAHPRDARTARRVAAEADAYVQKGSSLQDLVTALRDVLDVPSTATDFEPDPLSAVVAHGMLGTAAVLQGAASMLTHRWDRLPPQRRDDLCDLLRSQLDHLRDEAAALPAVVSHRVLNELVGLFELVDNVTSPDATHRHRIALFETADSALPRVIDILKDVVTGLPADVIAHLDHLRDRT